MGRNKYSRDSRDSLSAAAARKQVSNRPGEQEAMLRIYDEGWSYNEAKARALGTAEVGYYIHAAKPAVITSEDAFDLFSYHQYKNQRPFDQSHSTHLSESMLVAPAIDFAIGPSGHAVIVNGQHTMWAIYMRNQPTQASVTIYQCRDELAVAKLFAIFDSNKKRTVANAIHAAHSAGDFSYSRDVDAPKLHKWSQCIAIAENDFHRCNAKETLVTKVARARREDVQKFASWIEDVVNSDADRRMIPQGIGSAFYAMFLSDEMRAKEFITAYLSGINLDANSPVLLLRNKLLNRPRGQHDNSVCRMHAEWVYSAWRKFCLGESLMAMRGTTNLPSPKNWRVFEPAAV